MNRAVETLWNAVTPSGTVLNLNKWNRDQERNLEYLWAVSVLVLSDAVRTPQAELKRSILFVLSFLEDETPLVVKNCKLEQEELTFTPLELLFKDPSHNMWWLHIDRNYICRYVSSHVVMNMGNFYDQLMNRSAHTHTSSYSVKRRALPVDGEGWGDPSVRWPDGLVLCFMGLVPKENCP